MTDLLISPGNLADANAEGWPHLLLAHGASQPPTSPFFEALGDALVSRRVLVTRFAFPYMIEIQRTGKRRPPPRIETMFGEFDAAVSEAQALTPGCALFVGGKSMGGRIASLRADDLYGRGKIRGLVCLGYPFHPVKKPESLRTAHLADLACPALFVHGERDPFGTLEEVPGYHLSDRITVRWMIDGDHDLRPRKSSGRTHAMNIDAAAEAIAAFTRAT